MSELSAGVALGDELSAALARMRDASLPLDALDAEPVVEPDFEPVFEIVCGDTRVGLRADESIVIGRAHAGKPGAPGFVAVEHRTVSRRHVVLHHNGIELIAEDLGSRNGTSLTNGARSSPLVRPTALVEGDVLCTVDGVELARIVGPR